MPFRHTDAPDSAVERIRSWVAENGCVRRTASFRSGTRLLIVPLLGIALAAFVGSDAGGVGGIVAGVVIFVLITALAWWPRVVVDERGIAVRNIRTYRFAWDEVAGLAVEDQLPELGRFWRVFHGIFGQSDTGFLGLVVATRTRKVAAFALQATSPFFNPLWGRRSTEPRWFDRVADAVRAHRPDLVIADSSRPPHDVV